MRCRALPAFSRHMVPGSQLGEEGDTPLLEVGEKGSVVHMPLSVEIAVAYLDRHPEAYLAEIYSPFSTELPS
jgi:hypothetical protein